MSPPHQIEPELLGPTPRPVQHRAGRAARVAHGLIALWLIPFVLIGLGVLVFVAYRTILWQTQGVPYGNLEAGWVFALFWNAAMFLAVRHTLLDTRSRFLLYTTGTPVFGRITGKRLKEYSESEDCILEYEYSPAGVARPERGQVKTRRADWDAAQVGDALTVLYDAQRPALSVAYRYGEYVVPGAAHRVQ